MKDRGRLALKGDGAPAVAEFIFRIDRDNILFFELPNPAKDPPGVSIIYHRRQAPGT
jgi:hypothetical protein